MPHSLVPQEVTDPKSESKSSPNDHTNSGPLITGVVIAIFVLLAVMILLVAIVLFMIRR